MTEDKFRVLFGKRSGRFSKLSPINTEWWAWYDLLDVTKTLDFNCRFDKNGLCHVHARFRDAKHYANSTRDTMCCCEGCYHSVGYLDLLEDKAVKTIARYFTETKKHGFWRPGKGCVLPRKYRSCTCIGYLCGSRSKVEEDRPKLTVFERAVLFLLTHNVKTRFREMS